MSEEIVGEVKLVVVVVVVVVRYVCMYVKKEGERKANKLQVHRE